MNYLIVGIMCIIALAIGYVSLVENELIEPDRKRYLLILAPILTIEIILDTLGFYLDGTLHDSIELYRNIKTLEFIIAPIVPFMFAQVIGRNGYKEKIAKCFYVIIVINILTQLTNYIQPVVFYITQDAVYHRATLGWLYVANMTICMILTILTSKNEYMQDSTVSYTLICASIFALVGIMLRLYVDKCNADWLAISFNYSTIILVYNNGYLKLDGTTKTLNRKAFDNRYNSIHYRTGLVIIDANHFKEINDTFGHDTGDWALALIAEAIMNVYSPYGWVYRYGGDEFTVIYKPGVIKPNTKYQNKYGLNERLMDKLDKEIRKISKANLLEDGREILSKGVSQGAAIKYKSTLITEEEKKELFRLADKKMYERKKTSKASK